MENQLKFILFGLMVIVVLNSCTKDDKEEPEEKFCWACNHNRVQKNYECGTIRNTSGSMLLGRTTVCDMTVEEIRAYELSLASFSSVITDDTKCTNGHPAKSSTIEIRVTCKQIEE